MVDVLSGSAFNVGSGYAGDVKGRPCENPFRNIIIVLIALKCIQVTVL